MKLLGIIELMFNSIRMMIWNAQSVRSKFREYFAIIQQQKILILMISETHLASGDSFKSPGYCTYRLDRGDGRRGGGVALIVKGGLPHRLIPCPQTSVIEAIALELFLSGRSLVVASVYFPGSTDITYYSATDRIWVF